MDNELKEKFENIEKLITKIFDKQDKHFEEIIRIKYEHIQICKEVDEIKAEGKNKIYKNVPLISSLLAIVIAAATFIKIVRP